MAIKYVDENGVRVLWEKIQTRTESLTQETVYITLNSNNYRPIYTTITVSINDETTTYEYNNSPISFKVPGGIDYNIKLGEADEHSWPVGYDADEGRNETSIANYSRNLTYTYNTCKLIFSITPTNGSAITTYTHNGKTNTQNVSNGSYIYVPIFAEVTINSNTIDGYGTPAPHTIIARGESMTHSIIYKEKLSNGIYILDNNNNTHTVSSWTGGSNATGVVLISNYNALVIAPDEWWKYASNYGNLMYDDYEWNGNTRSAWSARDMNEHGPVPGVPVYEGSGGPLVFDKDGKNNTSKIIEYSRGYTYQSGDPITGEAVYNFSGAPAAEFCNAYSNGCIGVGEWYLPAVGELADIMNNFYEINEAMEKISGKPLRDDSDNYNSSMKWGYYWSSTIYLSGNTGKYRVSGYYHLEGTSHSVLTTKLATDNLNVRPVAKLDWMQ